MVGLRMREWGSGRVGRVIGFGRRGVFLKFLVLWHDLYFKGEGEIVNNWTDWLFAFLG